MRVFIAGGAGFIGSHFAAHWLGRAGAEVTVYDNLSSGRRWHLQERLADPRLRIVEADLQDLKTLTQAMAGHDLAYCFPSNPDIAKAATQPDIDFWQGTYLLQNLLEAMRVQAVPRLVFASGSGVYGDTGWTPVGEDHAPLLPISTYGASKLACEALISSYVHLFGLQGYVLRFANVIGPRQTHGVAYDFIRKLQRDPRRLEILGDGTQSKSYIHVTDIVGAIEHVVGAADAPFSYYNVATDDYLDVTTIAQLVIEAMGLRDVELAYTGGSRGWKGDVPVVRFDLAKIHALGWRAHLSSREAMQQAIRALLADLAHTT